MTPAHALPGRSRLLKASQAFAAAAAALEALTHGPEDRITREAREIVGRARNAAVGVLQLDPGEDIDT